MNIYLTDVIRIVFIHLQIIFQLSSITNLKERRRVQIIQICEFLSRFKPDFDILVFLTSSNILISNLTNTIAHNILPGRSFQVKCGGSSISSIIFTKKYPLSIVRSICKYVNLDVVKGFRFSLDLRLTKMVEAIASANIF